VLPHRFWVIGLGISQEFFGLYVLGGFCGFWFVCSILCVFCWRSSGFFIVNDFI
jgi:hypothetical protein